MKRILAAVVAGVATVATVPSGAESTADAIAEYRAMLADGNPADLWVAKGGELWKKARGPNGVSMRT